MFTAIAGFEFRYLLRNPLVWATAALTFVAFAAATSVPGFELGSEGGLVRNASYAVVRNLMLLSVIYMPVITAFVSNAVIRDDETGYGPIIRTTRISRSDYLLGRFFGAMAIVAGCLLVGALGLWLGTLMPWASAVALGPQRIAPYVFGFVLLALPNLIIGGAILFALAALTRSMMGTYLGVIAFASVFVFIGGALSELPNFQTAFTLSDPFGIRAVSDASRYWTVAQRNVLLPEFSGLLLVNRVLWLGIASAILAIACARYRFADRGLTTRERKQQRGNVAQETPATVPATLTLPAAAIHGASLRTLLWMRTRFESWHIVRSPAFPVLMAWGMFTTLISLTTQRDPDGRPTYPTTLSLIPELEGGMEVIPLLVAVYFAGELVWRERDRRIHEIVDASPMPNWAYVVPKTLAMGLVLVSMLLVAVLAAITVQLSLGYTTIEPAKYLLWFVLPTAWDMLLLSALTVFVHALSPHKVVAWGIMLIAAIVQQLYPLVQHNLLLYGGHPGVPLSDLAEAGSFWIGAWTFRWYWGAFALLLLVAAHVFWRRGVDVRLAPRLARARTTLRGAPGWVAAAALLVLGTTGAVAYRNTNVLNTYINEDDAIARMVDYEKQYARYLSQPQPEISHLAMNVALYPEERRAEVEGHYRLRNNTRDTVREIHVRVLDSDVRLREAAIAGARLVHDDTVNHHRIYRLEQPMASGEERELTFRTTRWIRGYRNGWPETQLVENGTFLNETQLAPVVGANRMGMLDDPELRREHGLPAIEPMAALGDSAAVYRPSSTRGWATSDVTVSTSADQTPLAAGNKVSDKTQGSRRTARFVSTVPLRARFVVISARYAEQHREHQGVKLSVYYHSTHAWNVERMLDAMGQSLDYYQANFGPYQFDHFRIVEFPGYHDFAQAFGGTIPYSETVGFIADYQKPETIDQVTGMTAHEFAHQWWAYQVAAANMEGEGVLSETLAQYAAHMVMKHVRGEDQIRRYLKFELDRYLDNRQDTDQPLVRAHGQQHLLYRKGALVMYLLQERLGEDAVNRALRSLVTRFRFQGAPYATASDLVAALRAEATTEEQQALITDLFERVTLYDLAVGEPTAVKRTDGRWDVTVPVMARKLYADSTGTETEAPLAESIEVGLFTAEPGRDAFDASHVVLMERRMIR
ncbi:MAG TPA: M1 family aminopeptidase, partial [Gemmatimonas sp.]|uniref:M1 family aminopeptidase n=1 Tax=Gemmatimonas sp. TaxID=1962908 RepID=UPI002EDAD607